MRVSFTVLGFVAILTACPAEPDTVTPDGPQVITPVAKPEPPPGEDGGSFRWHAADGELVTRGESPVVFDPGLRMWTYDLETGEAGPSIVSELSYFLSDDCRGEDYAIAQPPRVVFQYLGVPLFRLDTAPSFCAVSVDDGVNCLLVTEPCLAVVLVDDLITVVTRVPNPVTGPLHPEAIP